MARPSPVSLFDSDTLLNAEAPQPSAVAMAYLVKGTMAMFAMFAIVMLWVAVASMSRNHWRPTFDSLVAIVGMAVLIMAGAMLFILGRRQWQHYTLSIAGGKIRIQTPDQPVIDHLFDLADLAGAVLSKSSKRSGRSTLIVHRRKGWSIQSFTGCAFADLTLLMDAINRRVVQQNYSGFQVVLDAPGAAPQTDISVSTAIPLPVLPPAEEPRS